MQVTLGGERLGAGNRNKVWMHNYERSTHDLSFTWRSTMACGTLVPFMSEVALPGDTFDINLAAECLTLPTIGPLFGQYKIQLDVYQVPIRLYQAQLHMNQLGIGRDMSKVQLPQIIMTAPVPVVNDQIDNQQINPSCIFSYLGMRGIGIDANDPSTPPMRAFNAIPYLGYWDIYKNYYANKQEEIGAVISKELAPPAVTLTAAVVSNEMGQNQNIPIIPPAVFPTEPLYTAGLKMQFTCTGLTPSFDANNGILISWAEDTNFPFYGPLTALFQDIEVFAESGTVLATNPQPALANKSVYFGLAQINNDFASPELDAEPEIRLFDLKEIDDMRMNLLQWNPDNGPFLITAAGGFLPYSLPLKEFDPGGGNPTRYSKLYSQEGLGLKTYQSDLFNNWISTEWIDGPDGVSAVTAVDTSSGSFTIDELNLSKKIYDMLNRIAISGGTYDDWLDAVYTHERTRSAENPMYLGGLIKNLVFQEVVSNSSGISKEAGGQLQPLGTLAGRGTIGNRHKGGHIIAKIDEPSYIMGIVSLTPYVDYSQGNKWDVNLRTMNDFHKPALDQIGFQDLITDQMAWFDTKTDASTYPIINNLYKSAGKQPAWINYMTNVDVVRGNFADQNQQMFMVLNRRYTPTFDPVIGVEIADVTTYIDPVKFNHIFADTRRDAQNFWMQIAVNIEARRKMSAKVIPNL